ncbi:MAG: fumarylacetoacetate hydrolase family protein [Sandaracinaceae bacterium]
MRVVRTSLGGHARWGVLEDTGEVRLLRGPPWAGGTATDERLPAGADLLAPVSPSKIVCVGRNYRAHAAELGHDLPTSPLLFLKPPSALLPPGGTIRIPPESSRVDYEGEIAIVIGRRLRRGADAAAAERAVGGVTAANDVTARDLQRRDVQFTRGKGFDTFCPVGPWVETEVPSLRDIALRTRVNGELRQEGAADAMVFPIGDLLAFMADVMTLEPGDLVLTGTPAGVGPLEAGDEVEVEVNVAGTLSNVVAAGPAA